MHVTPLSSRRPIGASADKEAKLFPGPTRQEDPIARMWHLKSLFSTRLPRALAPVSSILL